MLIPISQFITPPPPPLSPLGVHMFVLYICVSISALHGLPILFIYLFIYLFLAALGLRCCAWAFSSCGEQGLLSLAVCGLLIAVASLVAEHGL